MNLENDQPWERGWKMTFLWHTHTRQNSETRKESAPAFSRLFHLVPPVTFSHLIGLEGFARPSWVFFYLLCKLRSHPSESENEPTCATENFFDLFKLWLKANGPCLSQKFLSNSCLLQQHTHPHLTQNCRRWKTLHETKIDSWSK